MPNSNSNQPDAPADTARSTPPAPRLRAAVRFALRLVSTVIAMTGFRLEHLNVVWVAGGAASIWGAQVLSARADWRYILPYFLFTLVFYYGLNAVILRSSLRTWLIACFGEERAFRIYETVAGLMFLNQGLGVVCMTALHFQSWEQPVPPSLLLAAGVVLSALGVFVKVWATMTAGVDVYYFRDMFLDRPLPCACGAGPYRYLRNPMYSVGQLQGYGYALLYASAPGLVAAAVGHALIYVFYLLAERPFVQSNYVLPRPAPPVVSALG